MNLKVSPYLEKIVAAAKEANISIHDLQFVRGLDTDVLEALSIVIEGNDEAKGYFSWLLAKSNLKTEPVG